MTFDSLYYIGGGGGGGGEGAWLVLAIDSHDQFLMFQLLQITPKRHEPKQQEDCELIFHLFNT